jgi:hypothetical protein
MEITSRLLRKVPSTLLIILKDITGEPFDCINSITLESNRLNVPSGMLEVMEEPGELGRRVSDLTVWRRRESAAHRPTLYLGWHLHSGQIEIFKIWHIVYYLPWIVTLIICFRSFPADPPIPNRSVISPNTSSFVVCVRKAISCLANFR